MSVCSTIGDSAPDLAGTNYASRIFHCVASALSREIPPGMPLADAGSWPRCYSASAGVFLAGFKQLRDILRYPQQLAGTTPLILHSCIIK
jgi:hypothetical protein